MDHRDWIAQHWKDFIQSCEGEFIRRTIAHKTGRGTPLWQSVCTRFTILDAYEVGTLYGSPLSFEQLSTRYQRRRKWPLWMAALSATEVSILQRHRSFRAPRPVTIKLTTST